MKKTCIIVETPFQLLNYINYVYHQPESSDEVFDLFVRDEPYLPDDMVEKVRETGLFGYICKYKYDMRRDFEQKLSADVFFYQLRRFLFPKKYIDSISLSQPNLSTLKYDQMFCSYAFHIARTYPVINPDVEIILFDDGVATYIDAVQSSTMKRKLQYMLRGKKSPWERINNAYVNNVDLCNASLAKNYYALPFIKNASAEFKNIVNHIFSYKHCSLYDSSRFVFLTQPYKPQNIDEFNDVEKQITETIEGCETDCTLRLHPRQGEYIETDMNVDTDNDLWELVCNQQITDNHVLIGCFSTAQITPKMVYDIEPWIIFTYELYPNMFTDSQKEKFSRIVEMLKCSYEYAEKVIVAESMDGLRKHIFDIKRNNQCQ